MNNKAMTDITELEGKLQRLLELSYLSSEGGIGKYTEKEQQEQENLYNEIRQNQEDAEKYRNLADSIQQSSANSISLLEIDKLLSELSQNEKDAQEYRNLKLSSQIHDEHWQWADEERKKLQSQHKKLADAIQELKITEWIIPILEAIARDNVMSPKNVARIKDQIPKLQNLLKESEKQ